VADFPGVQAPERKLGKQTPDLPTGVFGNRLENLVELEPR
jgi:hypothetical protein